MRKKHLTTGLIGTLTLIAFFLARIYQEPLDERFASLNKIHQLEKKLSGDL